MLILAGVSLNALVGDNGIITNAQSASFKTGIAVLEEWLQEKYVEYYDEAENYASKPELVGSKVKDLFFSSGGSNYIVSAMSGSVKKYYLINKQVLPKEIKDVLKGGDSKEYVDYINFVDIYGVTEDLKVYYCEDGITSGAVYGNLDGSIIKPETPLVKINEDSNMKKSISEALGINSDRNVTVGDIESLKNLTLNSSEITSIEGLSEAYGLKYLTLENVNIANLDGIESCTLLEKIYFKSSKIENYKKIENCINLKELYMYLPPAWEQKDCNDQVFNLCQGLHEASKIAGLTEFGISGIEDMLNPIVSPARYSNTKNGTQSDALDGSKISKLSTLSSLSLINDSIKNSVIYLYLNNNDLSDSDSVDSLGDFVRIENLVLANNKGLQKIGNLEKCVKLKYIYLYGCYVGNTLTDASGNTVTTYSGLNDISGIKNLPKFEKLYIFSNSALNSLGNLKTNPKLETIWAYSCDLTDITGLAGMTSLRYLSIYSNVNLYSISTIGSLTNLRSLWLANNENMNSEEIVAALETSGIMAQCGTNFSIPEKYKSLFTSLVADQRLADQDLTDDSEIITKFKTRADVTNVVTLDLSGNSQLTDDCLQTILRRMKNLRVLSLKDCTNLASIDFISEGNVEGLYELDLRGTSLTDLSNLENYGKSLDALLLDNYDIDFSKIQTVISNYLYTGKSNTTNISINSNNNNNGCFGLILFGDASQYSFPETCTLIENLRIMTGSISSANSTEILDLSDLPNLKTFYGRSEINTIKFPASLKSFSRDGGGKSADLSLCTNMNYVRFDTCSRTVGSTILSTLSVMPKEIVFYRSQNISNWDFLSRIIDSENNVRVDCSNLKILSVGSTASGDTSTISNLTGLEYATELEELTLGYNLQIEDFSVISKLTKLKKLIVCHSKKSTITSLSLLNDKNQAFTNSLETLEISNNKTITKLIGLDKYSTITSFKMYSTGISDLTGLSNNTGITEIDLHDNQISDLYELDKLIGNCGSDGLGFSTLSLADNSLGYYSNSGTDNAQVILNLREAGVTTIDVRGNTVANSDKLANISGIITK